MSIENNLDQSFIDFIDGTPFSKKFDDVYFSKQDGLQESHYVFLQHNQLAERWSSLDQNDDTNFVIAETGFGTGLNFLNAWQLWQQTPTDNHHLTFLSVEKYPLNRTEISQALAVWPELSELANQLLEQYPCPSEGVHFLSFGNVSLKLFIGDINNAYEAWLCPKRTNSETSQSTTGCVDAWFLDGFAPSKNPDMWSDSLFTNMTKLSHNQTSFATFTCAGKVRRGLEAAGFTTQKTKGFGYKREMLSGHYTSSDQTPENQQPSESNWFYKPNYQTESKEVIVIGAGLAGCHTARALANTGWQVSLIDSQEKIANGASGNRQSILYSRLSWPTDYLTQFNLSALQYALNFYSQQLTRSPKKLGKLCGVLQLAYNQQEQQRLQQLAEHFKNISHDFCQYLTRAEACELTEVDLKHDALYFPQAGYLQPKAICEDLINHPNIKLFLNTQITKVNFENAWQASSSDKTFTSSAVVICTAQNNLFETSPTFPLKIIRGQVSHMPENECSSKLKHVLCHQGYIAPSLDGKHDIGATFTLHEQTQDVLLADHAANLKQLAGVAPELVIDSSVESYSGRTGFRCSSTDYMPIVGAVPNEEVLTTEFSDLRKRAKKNIQANACEQAGLFINIAHGSRGLSSTPLCAAHIASLLNQQVSPLSKKMQRDLHPARFLIRQLKRREI